MKRWRNKLFLACGTAALIAAIPAIGQEAEAPESLLPPGFGDPEAPLPPPAESNTAQPPRPSPAPSSLPSLEGGALEELTLEEAEALDLLELPEPIEIPDASRRPVEIAGPLEAAHGGLGYDAFGVANGRFLSTLMRRLDAPTPSRWGAMLLRRALLSRVPTPGYVQPVDWIAERAWLLLRMGEADAARMLVQSVDVDQFTPKMFDVAVQTALATADPAALCPLVEPGREVSDQPVWPLADAMCASMAGESARASAIIDQTRRRSGVSPIDVILAEKVVGAGANTRRAVTVQWEGVDTINSWRFGLASATGLEIPEALIGAAGPHVRAWQARAPMLPIAQRLASAQIAASLGVLSSAALVDIHSLAGDSLDPSEINDSVPGRLRIAYAARDLNARMGALRALWGEAGNPVDRHARLILTATAAARIPPAQAFAGDAVNLISSMLTAGYDVQSGRWGNIVQGMEGENGARAWALLAVATPTPIEITAGRIESFAGADAGSHRGKMLLAALAGLGRIDPEAASTMAGDMGVRLDAQNRWTRMLEQAVRSRQPGTVALLAGVGMQTANWAGVPPEHFYHILRALRQVGLDYEARMIAAEAIARL